MSLLSLMAQWPDKMFNMSASQFKEHFIKGKVGDNCNLILAVNLHSFTVQLAVLTMQKG